MLPTLRLGEDRDGHRTRVPRLRWLRGLHGNRHDGVHGERNELHAGEPRQDCEFGRGSLEENDIDCRWLVGSKADEK